MELNQKQPHAWSESDLKMYVQNLGCPLLYKLGPKNHPFLTFHNLTVTLTAYIFWSKHDMIYIIRQVRWKLQEVSYIVSKCHELWLTNCLKWDCHFYPPSINSVFYFIARLRWQRSANGTQPNFAKWWAVNLANTLPYISRGSSLP